MRFIRSSHQSGLPQSLPIASENRSLSKRPANREMALKSIAARVLGSTVGTISVSKAEADYNQKIYTEQQKQLFGNKSIQRQIQRFRVFANSRSSFAPRNLFKMIRLLKTVKQLLGFYSRHKFYLNESLTVAFVRALSECYTKESSKWKDLKHRAMEEGKTLPSSLISLGDKKIVDILQYIDANFANFGPNSQISLLAYLHRISEKAFKEVLNSKVIIFAKDEALSKMKTRSAGLLFWLLASTGTKNHALIKAINNKIANDFLKLKAMNQSLIQESSERDTKNRPKKNVRVVPSNEPNDSKTNLKNSDENAQEKATEMANDDENSLLQAMPVREFCRLFWCLNELNYHGKLNGILSEEFISTNLISKMTYIDVQHVLAGMEMVPKPFQDRVIGAIIEKIKEDSQESIAKESERTLINILVKLTHLNSSGDHSAKIMKGLLNRKERLGSKALSLIMWSIPILKPGLIKSERVFLQKAIIAKLDSLNVHDVAQILTSLHKITLDSKYHASVANFDNNDLDAQLIKRLQLLRKQITKVEFRLLSELVTSNAKRYNQLKLIINN